MYEISTYELQRHQVNFISSTLRLKLCTFPLLGWCIIFSPARKILVACEPSAHIFLTTSVWPNCDNRGQSQKKKKKKNSCWVLKNIRFGSKSRGKFKNDFSHFSDDSGRVWTPNLLSQRAFATGENFYKIGDGRFPRRTYDPSATVLFIDVHQNIILQ